MVLAFGVAFGIAVLAALLWPATYRSTGTILIEQQEIPTDFVRSAVTSYAAQRVQVISQRVMTSTNLIGIIDKYKLYPSDRDRATREALVDRMRDDMKLDMISADVVDPRAGQTTKATIAFSVSFDSRSPTTAAQVANELTTLYLSENVESRRQRAADTETFLKDESDRLGQRVAELESKIADFKREHGADLPEYVQLNIQMLDRGQQELRTIETRMQSIDQQLVYLDAQLAQLSPSAAGVAENGEQVLSPAHRLRMLQDQLAAARARYNPDHPDVTRLTREVTALRTQLGVTDEATGRSAESTRDIAHQLDTATAQLAATRQKYGSDHPDVTRLEREVASLQLAKQQTSRSAQSPELGPTQVDPTADNPAYIQIRAQRTAALNERAALAAEIPLIRARIANLERRQVVAPEVEKNYGALQRDLAGERTKYNEVRQKQLEAQLAQNLETERKGERFTLIEPPLTPQAPVRPNRPAILLLGFVLAVACAVALMFLLETLDTRVRDRAQVLKLLDVPPLAVIPLVELDEDRAARSRRRCLVAIGAVGVVAATLAVVHVFIRPLDLVWLALLNRFGA
jgi:uncharacterized protein involved in exopolysaccharide biosynthesis